MSVTSTSFKLMLVPPVAPAPEPEMQVDEVLDIEGHRRWCAAIRHLDAALRLFDEAGLGGETFACDAQSALDWSKRHLRHAMRGEAVP